MDDDVEFVITVGMTRDVYRFSQACRLTFEKNGDLQVETRNPHSVHHYKDHEWASVEVVKSGNI